MERYAFIDVPNTTGTTRDLLDFSIDWEKLITHLTGEKWRCTNVFYYQGMRKGRKHEKKRAKLEKIGYIVRSKRTHIHPDKTTTRRHICESCGIELKIKIKKQGDQKSNCDVELTVDALETTYTQLDTEKEFLLFTGDGDFSALVEKLIERGSRVKIISNTRKNKRGEKRFSTRLQGLIDQEERSERRRVIFIDINDWKNRIKKEPPSSVAAPER